MLNWDFKQDENMMVYFRKEGEVTSMVVCLTTPLDINVFKRSISGIVLQNVPDWSVIQDHGIYTEIFVSCEGFEWHIKVFPSKDGRHLAWLSNSESFEDVPFFFPSGKLAGEGSLPS